MTMLSQEQKVTASLLYMMTRFIEQPSCQLAASIMHHFDLLESVAEQNDSDISTIGRRLKLSWRSIQQKVHDDRLLSRLHGMNTDECTIH